MTTFEIRDAKPWHCGQMSRMLRQEHHEAALRVGMDSRRGLRDIYGQSYYRRAWFIDGELAGLGGVKASLLSPAGFIWLALSQRATCYPIAIVKEARQQLAEIMKTKAEIYSTIIDGDEAAKRLVIFLGFHLDHSQEGAPAYSIHGRRRLHDLLATGDIGREMIGGGSFIRVGYHNDYAHQ